MLNENLSIARLAAQHARWVADVPDADWPRVFDDLLRSRQLHAIVRQINALMTDPAHEGLARTALKRMGLELGA